MPWRPRGAGLELNPRLARYGNRVAQILDGPDPVGYLLVVPDVWSI